RSRASRMESLDDLDALRRVLKPLVERKLVVYLTAEDRRGAVLTHGFHDPRELEALRKHHAVEPVAPSAALAGPPPRPDPAPACPAPAVRAGPAPPPPPPPPLVSRAEQLLPQLEASLAEARDEIAALKQTVGELRGTVQSLAEELRGLKQALGA